MKRRTLCFYVWLGMVLLQAPAFADQPIFDEMPRWNDGWGFQLVEEYRTEETFLRGTKPLGADLTETVHILHLEGVYTWTKSVRVTGKLPFVLSARRDVPDAEGERRVENDQGLGDFTLAVPLKHYFNLDGRTGSWTMAPQLKVPLANTDEYDVYDRVWGHGLSLGYDTETYRYHLGLGATGWVYHVREPAEAFLQLSLGINIQGLGSSGHLKWKSVLHYEADDSLTFSAGPTVYWRFADHVHGQLAWLHDFYDRQGTVDHGDGDAFRVGLGFVF